MKFIAYHGSQHKSFKYDNRALYFTTSKKQAESYAKREWDEGLIEGEVPVVYTAEVTINNPIVINDSDQFFDFCDSNMNEWYKDEIIEQGYDSVLFESDDGTKLVCVFNESQFKIIDTEVLPKSHKYYYPKEDGIDPNDVDDYYYDGNEQLNEGEYLNKFNRIAGFYHWDTDKFEYFPRTTEEISAEEDEINDYIHNVQSKDEFTEFKIVRFGIEDITGEGRVCYIEGDTWRNVEQCYFAIIDEYQDDLHIEKFELEYYVGNQPKYKFYDMYGDEIMESYDNQINEVLKVAGINESI